MRPEKLFQHFFLCAFYVKTKWNTAVYEYSGYKNVFKKRNYGSTVTLTVSSNGINSGTEFSHTLNLHHVIALGVAKTSIH